MRIFEEGGLPECLQRGWIERKMDAMAPTHRLDEKDKNVEVIKRLRLPHKKNRNVWTEKKTILDQSNVLGRLLPHWQTKPQTSWSNSKELDCTH